MNKAHYYFLSFLLIIIVTLVSSCNGQRQSPKESNSKTSISSVQLKIKENKVIKPENGFNSGLLDSNGNLWFGSNGGGVYRYNGRSFEN